MSVDRDSVDPHSRFQSHPILSTVVWLIGKNRDNGEPDSRCRAWSKSDSCSSFGSVESSHTESFEHPQYDGGSLAEVPEEWSVSLTPKILLQRNVEIEAEVSPNADSAQWGWYVSTTPTRESPRNSLNSLPPASFDPLPRSTPPTAPGVSRLVGCEDSKQPLPNTDKQIIYSIPNPPPSIPVLHSGATRLRKNDKNLVHLVTTEMCA